jgi:hypothetical protein
VGKQRNNRNFRIIGQGNKLEIKSFKIFFLNMIEKLRERILLNVRKALIEEIRNMNIENENKEILDEIRNESYQKYSQEFPSVFSEFINSSIEDIVEALSKAIILSILKPPDEQYDDEVEKIIRKGYLLAWLKG